MATLNPDEKAEYEFLTSAPADFPEFVSRAMPAFEWYPAQRLIADALDAVARDELRRLMIFMPPQEGKTELVSKLFPAYYLQCWPNRWVGVGSYSFGLAKTFSRAARSYFREVVTDLSDEAAAVEQWETPRKGGLWAVGRGGSATGRPAHLAIIDDPLKDRAEAESDTIRQTLHEWYASVINMRLQPQNACVLVHTRWHEDDLSGHLLEVERTSRRPERWHVLELPGLAKAPHERTLYPPSVTVQQDWRTPGQPLGGRYGLERYEQIREVSGSREFESQVQQNPAPSKGVIFQRAWWKRYSEEPDRFDRVIISADCAFKDADDSDFVALHVWGRVGADVYLLDRIHERLSFTNTQAALKDLMRANVNAVVYIEDKANGTAIVDSLQQELMGVLAVEPEGGKVARAYACQGDVERGRVYLPTVDLMPDVDEFIREAASFPTAPHDDDVDAFTQAMAVYRMELRAALPKKVAGLHPDRHPGYDPETHARIRSGHPDPWQHPDKARTPPRPRVSHRGSW